jgi:hypothetical protein
VSALFLLKEALKLSIAIFVYLCVSVGGTESNQGLAIAVNINGYWLNFDTEEMSRALLFRRGGVIGSVFD